MHIPDGFLSILVSGVMWLVTLIVVANSLKRVNKDFDERTVPMMGVLASAIFAGQMLNFTVIGGTSGHLMGAAIATILLGPWPAILVMTTVVGVQALIFQDGGLLVLGANIFNMAILGVSVSYMVYRGFAWLTKRNRWRVYVAGFMAAWTSVVLVSASVAFQLAFSGTSPANIALPAMVAIHSLIGIGEGLITVGALVMISASRPDLLNPGQTPSSSSKVLWVAGFVISLILVIASPLASTDPDGLERVAEQLGFLETTREAPFRIIPDYVFPGIQNEVLATILAGVLGAVLILGAAVAMAYTRRKRRSTNT